MAYCLQELFVFRGTVNSSHKGGLMNTNYARQYTRVDFQRDVQLDFDGKKYIQNTVNNLSLGGMYV